MKKLRPFFLQQALTLVLIVAGVILVVMHVSISNTLKDLSQSLITRSQDRTELELNGFFQDVKQELEKTARQGELGMFDELSIEALNPHFIPLLSLSPQISSVQIANDQGQEYMLMHKDSVWINRMIQRNKNRNWIMWQNLDQEHPKVISAYEDENSFLIEEKDWFKIAIEENPEGELQWMRPYRFKTASKSGLTVSVPFQSANQPGITYVIAVDVLLSDISRFTMGLEGSLHERKFVITDEGKTIGLPQDPELSDVPSLEPLVLVPAKELGIPSLTKALETWEKKGKPAAEPFRFSLEREGWWGGMRPFSLGGETYLYLGVAVPESDFLSSVQRTRNIIYLGWALILALALLVWNSVQRQKKARQLMARQDEIIAEEKRKAELEKQKAHIEAERVERLEQVDKLKDEFLANTSHELRTPLNGIIGISEYLMEGGGNFTEEEVRHQLSMIISSGKRLSTLVDDLLDFSKLRSHTIALQQKPLDIRSLTEIVLRLTDSLARVKNLGLYNDISPDTPSVLGDENRLQQILFNLIGNAIKFTDKGEIRVSAREKEGMVEIEVSDTGIGIPAEKLDTIFTSFEQADGDISRTYGGTGLGLTITRKLVELHGGHIRVESEPGKGSNFFFSLPISDTEAEGELLLTDRIAMAKVAGEEEELPALTAAGPKDSFSQSVRILVVDDEPINLHVITNHLTAANYSIQAATNGEEALQILDRDGPFDLVLLDLMMPKMSGYEVCQRIREKYLPSELPVIFITAKNQVGDLVQGLAYGANDYLAKPFSKNEFLARVKTHLNLLNINTAYGKFVPHEFLRALGRESILDVKLGDQTERNVSVLFSDIRSYTTLSESMTPEENFNFINAYVGRMGPPIKQNRGIVNQYLGDGIMALFPREPEDAVKAALEMQREIARYNLKRGAADRMLLRVGMGIHTGSLRMGIIGDIERLDAAIVSDTVNTAARLEGLTKYFRSTLIISSDTLAQLSHPESFNYRYLGKVQVKGKHKPVDIYEFFDGDEPEIKDAKSRTKKPFEAGLTAYYQRDFEKAIQYFHTCRTMFPEDVVAEEYLVKARDLRERPLPDDWQGVETMETK
ncbi:MAG: ATP-binding protein [Bacteroidota bacterium]